MTDQTFRQILSYCEELAVRADAPHADLARAATAIRGMFVESGLDPADPNHRRAFALGLIAGARTPMGAELVLSVAAALRPPVVR